MKHKDKILELREQEKSYKEICKELGCSIGTVSYHCGAGQKEKHKQRSQKNRTRQVISQKIHRFKNKKSAPKKEVKSNSIKLLRHKADDFQRGTDRKQRDIKFSYHDVLKKFGEQTACYLTGCPIDLKEPLTYQFDHIKPASKGGCNEIDNLGICTRNANQAKSDMSVGELLEFCKKVLEYNGYEVNRREPNTG